MLTLDQLRREPLYQEFDGCFTGHFKQTLTDIRVVLTLDECDLTEAVSLIRDCWDEFQAIRIFMASGMADFISGTYAGTHEPRELEREFRKFLFLILEALEYSANARYRSERRHLNYGGADEAQRVLVWIADVRAILVSKARIGVTDSK